LKDLWGPLLWLGGSRYESDGANAHRIGGKCLRLHVCGWPNEFLQSLVKETAAYSDFAAICGIIQAHATRFSQVHRTRLR
jgi:hypothetical protein